MMDAYLPGKEGRMAIFGSFARRDETEKSDVDILVHVGGFCISPHVYQLKGWRREALSGMIL